MIELHCHLDGLVDPAMLRDLARSGVRLPLSADELQAMLPVTDIESFIAWFGVAHRLEGSLTAYAPIVEKHVERLVAQGVDYAELMVGSSELPRDPEEMAQFRQWLNGIEAGRIQIELLLAVNRTRPPEHFRSVLQIASPYFDSGALVGVAIAGWPEQGYPALPLKRHLAELGERGVGIEIHAGEWAGPASVRDALDCGADRIGHAVGAFEDDELIDEIAKRGVHIEICPTSNLKTGSVESLRSHPIAVARDRELSFSINTDDPGAFECTLVSEYALMRRLFSFDDDDFKRMNACARAAKFGRRTS
jgi:adenosine deaminase